MKLFLSILFSFFLFLTYSQVNRTNYPVTFQDQILSEAWAGGLNAPQFSKIDLNDDGVKDLFVFDRGWDGTIKTFLYQNNQFVYAPEYQQNFPVMRNWVLLRDYNCDGKEDIFTWSEFGGGISVYKNQSVNGVLSFQRVENLLFTNSINGDVNIYVNSVDIPGIEDVDGDGDLDILAFSIGGIQVEMQENLSMDLYGVCDSLEFQLRDACWGKFAENGLTNELNLDVDCADLSPGQVQRHGGSTIALMDKEGDGDMDMLLGDVSYSNLVYANNGGSSENAYIDYSNNDFPPGDNSVDLKVFPSPFILDVDNDGLKDLLVSPNVSGFSMDKNNVLFYKNTGSETVPRFNYVQSDFLSEQMIDVGYQAQPVLIDVNGDDLTDILIFSESEFKDDQRLSSVTLLLNNGTSNEPSFIVSDTNYLDFRSYEISGAHASFGDLDDDNDLDMIVSDQGGTIYYFKNFSNSSNELDLSLMDPNYFDLDLDAFGTPFLYDINGDRALDIISGNKRGELVYYENQGSTAEALFVDSVKVEMFGNIDVSEFCCGGYSSPFIKEKGDSLLLYVGSEEQILYTYIVDVDDFSSDFEMLDSVNYKAVRLKPFIGDTDNDGLWDILLGEVNGGVQTYELEDLNISTNNKKQSNVLLYPNPVSKELFFNDQVDKVFVFDAYGRLVLIGENVRNINMQYFEPGIYFIEGQLKGQRFSNKILKAQ